MLIFVSTTLFSHQRSEFEDTSDNWLPTILVPGLPKWLQKLFKMSEIVIFSKLIDLGYQCLCLPPPFHTG